MNRDERFDRMEKNCDRCGKEFVMPCGDWAYKRYKGKGVQYFCSWKCIRAYEREHDKPKKIDERERIIQALADGLSVKEVSTLLDVDTSKVSYWYKRMKKENV
jgi:DNA-binding NarL/FixJ family response regulator